jgi:hypothetical protein
MISTVVTTSTVTTTTATAITSSLALIGIVVLLALMVQKEFISSSEKKTASRLNQTINIALPPLLITFAIILLARISEFLK